MGLIRITLAIVLVVGFAGCKAAPRELEPTPSERTDMKPIARTIPPHEPVPGSTARTALLFTHTIPGLKAHVEVREYYVNQGSELIIQAPSEALFEVRSGRFEVFAQNETGERGTGHMWSALPGERVAVRTTSEMAILRATYIFKD